MDVELQILKHLKRDARPTVSVIDRYCSAEALRNQKITVIIDETGDRKKGKKTDYVARQYLGQPTILFWMIIPWLDVFPNRSLLIGFHQLISIMNQFYFSLPDG